MDTRDDFAQEKLNPGTKRPRDDDNSDAQAPQPPKRPSTRGRGPRDRPPVPRNRNPWRTGASSPPPFRPQVPYRRKSTVKNTSIWRGPTTQGTWDNLKGHKVLAHIPNDWYRLDPTTTIRIVSRVAKLVTGNDNLSVLPATPQFPSWPKPPPRISRP